MPPIALDRTPAFQDTDNVTRQTVEKMCELIRASISDPQTDPTLQNIAAQIKQRYCWGSDDQAALAFGVFWWVKHHITFRSDEGTMFQIGQPNQQDLLIRPDILVKMQNPSEDCDGFTMLTAALLTILRVPVVIATVAVDLEDPTRWSHVFLCAIVNGRVMPLDTSHGKAPGWMVPRNRINRWQTWTLDGRPADVQIPTHHGLNGYVRAGVGAVRRLPIPFPVRRRHGVGQDDSGDWFETDITQPIGADLSTIGGDLSNVFSSITGSPSVIATSTGINAAPYFQQLGVDASTTAAVAPLVQAPPGYSGPTIVSASSSTPAAPTGYQWAQLINQSGNNIAKILTVATGGTAITLPNGNQLLYGAGASNAAGANLLTSISSATGLSSSVLLIGGLALLAVLVLKK